MSLLRPILIVFGCIITCVIMSLPYSFLAGESITTPFPTSFFACTGTLVVGFARWLETKMTKSVWILLIFFCLPIIFNGLSLISDFFGFHVFSYVFFNLRYEIMWYVLLIAGVSSTLIWYLRRRQRKKRLIKRIPGN